MLISTSLTKENHKATIIEASPRARDRRKHFIYIVSFNAPEVPMSLVPFVAICGFILQMQEVSVREVKQLI